MVGSARRGAAGCAVRRPELKEAEYGIQTEICRQKPEAGAGGHPQPQAGNEEAAACEKAPFPGGEYRLDGADGGAGAPLHLCRRENSGTDDLYCGRAEDGCHRENQGHGGGGQPGRLRPGKNGGCPVGAGGAEHLGLYPAHAAGNRAAP